MTHSQSAYVYSLILVLVDGCPIPPGYTPVWCNPHLSGWTHIETDIMFCNIFIYIFIDDVLKHIYIHRTWCSLMVLMVHPFVPLKITLGTDHSQPCYLCHPPMIQLPQTQETSINQLYIPCNHHVSWLNHHFPWLNHHFPYLNHHFPWLDHHFPWLNHHLPTDFLWHHPSFDEFDLRHSAGQRRFQPGDVSAQPGDRVMKNQRDIYIYIWLYHNQWYIQWYNQWYNPLDIFIINDIYIYMIVYTHYHKTYHVCV